MAHLSRYVSGIHTGMQAQRSVRVPGLLRPSFSYIYTPQCLVPDLQWSARICEPFSGSGISEDKAGWRPCERTLSFKSSKGWRLQIHISNFVGLRSFVASPDTGCINADLLETGIHSGPSQSDLLRRSQASKNSHFEIVAPHWMECGIKMRKNENYLVTFQGIGTG